MAPSSHWPPLGRRWGSQVLCAPCWAYVFCTRPRPYCPAPYPLLAQRRWPPDSFVGWDGYLKQGTSVDHAAPRGARFQTPCGCNPSRLCLDPASPQPQPLKGDHEPAPTQNPKPAFAPAITWPRQLMPKGVCFPPPLGYPHTPRCLLPRLNPCAYA